MLIKKCIICGKEFIYTKGKKCCSKECSSELRRRTNMEKYGVLNVCKLQKPKTKKCKICGKEFEAINNNSRYCEECKKPKVKVCRVCGKEFIDRTANKSKQYCKSCTTKQTNLERYGVDNVFKSEEVKQSIKDTLKNNYGVDHPMHSDKIKTKLNNTSISKYGVPWSFQSDSVKTKSLETIKQRYGVNSSQKIPGVENKKKRTILSHYGSWNNYKGTMVKNVKQTKLNRYGNPNYNNREKCKETMIQRYGPNYASDLSTLKGKTTPSHIKVKRIITCYKKYGVPYPCMTKQCRLSGKAVSKLNLDFGNKLKVLGCNLSYEFALENKNYDIFVKPNILIEIDPSYTHNLTNGRYDRNYHLLKTQIANRNGYRCIHIFDWEDKTKILNLFNTKDKIYARKCKIKEINKQSCDEFLNKYHLQNTCKGQQVRLGLFYNDELVQVMTFGKPRYNKNYQYELLRLCSHKKYKVVGGSNKLFKYFIKTYNPQSMISYCDISKFNGEVYSKLGFKLLYTTKPNKHWSKYKHHITNNLLQQKGYDQLFKTNYGKGTNNEQLMLDSGWLPIYDCGQNVYAYYPK